jgi:hypothetical protein
MTVVEVGWDGIAKAAAGPAGEFGIGAEAGGVAGWAEGIVDGRGFFAGATVIFPNGVLQALLAAGALAGETGFVIGPGLGRKRRQDVVLGANGLGRRSRMPGVDVALLGRGLVEGVRSVQELPGFLGSGGDGAKVVEAVLLPGLGRQVTGDRLRVTGDRLRVRVGADEGFVIDADAVDGFAGRLGVFEAGGAGEGEGGDLGGPDGGAGAGGVELIGEQAVGDLGHEELDGGGVFEEGDGDVIGIGEGGKAVVVVGVAEVEAAEDGAATAAAVSPDGAALG